ncbi:MAG: VIT and VWA domain-containing protein [Planctomycetota bacterium]|jgi:hypothetical protein|nr:VIT and VWA domain-containing protein [Planctomycetota bacterium]
MRLKTLLAPIAIAFLYLSFTQQVMSATIRSAGPNGTDFTVVDHKVDVQIAYQIAHTKIVQIFRNPSKSPLEAVYFFQKTSGAVITRFRAKFGGQVLEGKVLEREQALNLYQSFREQNQKAALLQKEPDFDIFQVRLASIQPQQKVSIEMEWVETLPYRAGRVRYRYPTNGDYDNLGIQKNFRLKWRIHSPFKILRPICTSGHILRHEARNSDYKFSGTVSLQNKRFQRDVEIEYYAPRRDSGIELATYREEGQPEGTFLLLITPERFSDKRIPMARHIHFLVDTSQHTANSLSKVQTALISVLEQLQSSDHFNLTVNGPIARKWKEKLVPVTSQSIQDARTFLIKNTSRPESSTHYVNTLKDIYSSNARNRSAPLDVILITGSEPNSPNDLRNLNPLSVTHSTIRTHVLALGSPDKTFLLREWARQSRGFAWVVSGESDLEKELIQHLDRLAIPAFTNLHIDFGDIEVRNVCSNALPELLVGEQILITGQYRTDRPKTFTTITLNGIHANRRFRERRKIFFPKVAEHLDMIPPLWASRHLENLQKLWESDPKDSIREEMVRIAIKEQIASPHTSFVVIPKSTEIQNDSIEESNAEKSEEDIDRRDSLANRSTPKLDSSKSKRNLPPRSSRPGPFSVRQYFSYGIYRAGSLSENPGGTADKESRRHIEDFAKRIQLKEGFPPLQSPREERSPSKSQSLLETPHEKKLAEEMPRSSVQKLTKKHEGPIPGTKGSPGQNRKNSPETEKSFKKSLGRIDKPAPLNMGDNKKRNRSASEPRDHAEPQSGAWDKDRAMQTELLPGPSFKPSFRYFLNRMERLRQLGKSSPPPSPPQGIRKDDGPKLRGGKDSQDSGAPTIPLGGVKAKVRLWLEKEISDSDISIFIKDLTRLIKQGQIRGEDLYWSRILFALTDSSWPSLRPGLNWSVNDRSFLEAAEKAVREKPTGPPSENERDTSQGDQKKK